MYSPLQIAFKYLRYLLVASNGKGHGIHSPYVFEWIEKALQAKTISPLQSEIEAQRKYLLTNKNRLEVNEMGAGSNKLASKQRSISDIAKTSLKPFKYANLIYRIAAFHQPKTIVELGTSLGITTSYLASIPGNPMVYTFEGVHGIAETAKQNFERLKFSNIKLIEGNFDHSLPSFLALKPSLDFVYVDGNHRKEPTLTYFNQLLTCSHEHTMMIFDDIHWSKEMEEAWELVKSHESVTLTIDLFFIGIVLFRKDFKVKQHFTIRY